LPVGVLIYIVLSNCVQSFQTWILMKRPVPPLVSVLDDEDGPIIDSPGSGPKSGGDGGGGGGSKKKGPKGSGPKGAASVKAMAKASSKKEDKERGAKIKINPANGKVTVNAGESVSGEPVEKKKKKKK